MAILSFVFSSRRPIFHTMNRMLTGIVLVMFPMAPLTASAQDEVRNWKFSTSVSLSRGDYGTATTTEVLSVPFAVKRFFEHGDISLTIPYIRITGDGTVVPVGGDRGGGESGGGESGGGSRSGSGKGSSGGKGGSGSSSGGESATVSTVAGARTTNQGLGDITVFGRYYLLDEEGLLPSVSVTGRVKFPTADDGKGLGTGKFDEGVGLEFSKFLTDSFVAYVDGGYAIIGEPSGSSLDNQWNYDVGLGFYVTDALFASVFYEEFGALVATAPNPRDVYVALDYTVSQMFRVSLSGFQGLSNGASDYGVTGGLSVRF